MSYLRYFCLFTYCGVQHLLWFCFVFVCFRLVYPMLPVSLDCPFLIAPSVFSNVYLESMFNAATLSTCPKPGPGFQTSYVVI
jgi:hypothetical protein